MADIKKKPTEKVGWLSSPTRSGITWFKATWKNGASLFDSKNNKRFSELRWDWRIDLRTTDGKKTKTIWVKPASSKSSQREEANLNLADFTQSNGKWTNLINETYPTKSYWSVYKITVRVWGANNYGSGPKATAERLINPPKAPSLSALTQSTEGGDVPCTISCDSKANEGYNPRTDTRWRYIIVDTRKTGNKRKTLLENIFSGNSTSVTYDVSDRQQLSYTDYVHLRVEAWCRGFGGTSGTSSRELYVAWPNQPTIDTQKVTCPSRTSNGKVTIPLNLQWKKEHPVTGCRLQKLVGVTWTKPSQIPATADWQNCGVADDGNCYALSVPVAEVIPEEGTRTWIRVKSWNQIEGLFVRYSAPLELKNLYVSAGSTPGGTCSITSIASTPDGAGVEVVIGFNDDGNTGCEIAWSTDEDAWWSADQPQTFQFTWTDSERKSTNWARTTTVKVPNLTEGTKYYFRARRYTESDSGTTYSSWSGMKSVTPALIPSDVVLSVPGSVRRGEGCEASWTYTGGTQRSWKILSNGVVVKSGRDQLGGCSLSASVLNKYVGSDGSIPLSVVVSTAGGQAESAVSKIFLAYPPTLSIDDVTCEAQPLTLDAYCSDGNSTVALTLRAQGCTALGPGQDDQVEGDVVWSERIKPAWEVIEEDEQITGYQAVITAPTGLDLRNGAKYTLTATASDPDTGLASEEIETLVTVDWARQAPIPEAVVTPSDVTDDAGLRTLSCTIFIDEPEDGLSTDMCDVWRVTQDGEYLVCSDVPYDTYVTDPWAAYSSEGSEVAYCVVAKTVDGDLEAAYFPYELSAGELRIDFDGVYVELPFNLRVSDAWGKDHELHTKWNGDHDAYYNPGVKHETSFSSDIIRITDASKAALVKRLGKYTAPCLLRSPDGRCYMATVDVDELSWAFTDVIMAVSLKTTEVTSTSAYMATVDGIDDMDVGS